MINTTTNKLINDCSNIKGVGSVIKDKLAKCGINTILDLFLHLPYRYQDKTRITPIKYIQENEWCVISGRVCKIEVVKGKRTMLNCFVEDKTGIITLRFFHFNKQQVESFNKNPQISAFGEVKKINQSLGMVHPEYKILNEDEICSVQETLTPIYPTTKGLSQSRIRQIIASALNDYKDELNNLEWMDMPTLCQNNFQPLPLALENLHNPPPDLIIENIENGNHQGLQRIVFDELLAKRLSMQFAKKAREKLKAPIMLCNDEIIDRLINDLPFKLTQAQTRVFKEIQQDLIQNKPMLRLVQGDVGSGKTIVSALAALQVIKSGYQVAIMAPTDILSEQHFSTITKWLEPLDIKINRLTGKMKASSKTKTLEALATNTCQLVIGTHALFQSDVNFAKLGLIIIDEQHRFGVLQRAMLQQKGQTNFLSPHQLLMTATPIPRTLAMTEFAHLDLSAIDEMPPGRTPVTTAIINQDKHQIIIERLNHAIKSGRQAYWVCTLIDESEHLQCIAATNRADELQNKLSTVRVGLIHGRLKASEKELIMQSFKKGEIDLLVATTVIEVGVDVPNASLMIIENAERLGLSQLHQLRGRVGRGTSESHCLLLYQMPLSNHSRERLQVMRATTDGFLIAEKDLELRGSGDFLGTQQTGYNKYKVADLKRDKDLLPMVAKTANSLINSDPTTSKAIAKRWLGDFESFIIS